MTQKEFEERTELKLTADNYTEVETCYMNTDLDKDAFCKLWMKNPAALKEIAHKHNAIFGWDYICGDVVMCKDEEVQ